MRSVPSPLAWALVTSFGMWVGVAYLISWLVAAHG